MNLNAPTRNGPARAPSPARQHPVSTFRPPEDESSGKLKKEKKDKKHHGLFSSKKDKKDKY
jgi:hypothetical protein